MSNATSANATAIECDPIPASFDAVVAFGPWFSALSSYRLNAITDCSHSRTGIGAVLDRDCVRFSAYNRHMAPTARSLCADCAPTTASLCCCNYLGNKLLPSLCVGRQDRPPPSYNGPHGIGRAQECRCVSHCLVQGMNRLHVRWLVLT